MGGYKKHKGKYPKDDDYDDYYDHHVKVNSISSHLYVAYKSEESIENDKEENCESPEEAFKIKSWSLLKELISRGSQIESQFNKLASEWKDETGLFSTTYQKIVNDLYFDIVAMGPEVVPFILKDLQNNGPAHWHTALKALTKENPVPNEYMSNNKRIKEYWIEWGKNKNLI